jgi:putative glutathione S-transferase
MKLRQPLGFLVTIFAPIAGFPSAVSYGPRRLQRLQLDRGFNILEVTGKFIPQGALVGGVKETWRFAWSRMMAELAPQKKDGSYARPAYTFDGVLGSKEFPFEKGRYHAYLGNPCPWCHRISLALALTGLSPVISTTQLVDDPTTARRGGWCFGNGERRDAIFSERDLYGVYEAASPGYKGRCTAPLLVDKKTKKIVSNESKDIVRMLSAVAEAQGSSSYSTLRPQTLEREIDEMEKWMLEKLNNGVYRCGFATSQQAYNLAAEDVKEGLHMLERQLDAVAATEIDDTGELESYKFLLPGKMPTEVDVFLLPTVLRFDAVYAPLFRAAGGQLRIRDFPRLSRWMKACWELEGVPETIDLADACGSYYRQLFPLNPGGLVPTPPTPRDLGLE